MVDVCHVSSQARPMKVLNHTQWIILHHLQCTTDRRLTGYPCLSVCLVWWMERRIWEWVNGRRGEGFRNPSTDSVSEFVCFYVCIFLQNILVSLSICHASSKCQHIVLYWPESKLQLFNHSGFTTYISNPFNHPALYRSIQFIHPSIHPSFCLYNPSTHSSIHSFIYPSIHSSFHSTIFSSIHPSYHLSIRSNPSIHPSTHLSVHSSI